MSAGLIAQAIAYHKSFDKFHICRILVVSALFPPQTCISAKIGNLGMIHINLDVQFGLLVCD